MAVDMRKIKILFLKFLIRFLCKINCIKKINGLKKKQSGIAVLEASLTLPIVLIMIFFIFEMINVNNARSAMDTIALEASLDFVANKNTNGFNGIIEKYRPSHIDPSRITYYFAVYESLAQMCSASPYGGEEVFWPESDTSFGDSTAFIDTDGNNAHLTRSTVASAGHILLKSYKEPEEDFSSNNKSPKDTLVGKAFVLTFVCDFPFSSAFVQKLFLGGSNTVDKSRFLIWGRGVGICN